MPERFDFRHSRDGTSQRQRRLAALDPSEVPVDARGVNDFLVFAQRLARQVIYYGLDNQDQGQDWQAFFQCDPSVAIASIAKFNPLADRQAIRDAVEGPPIPESLRQLFQHVLLVARMLDNWRKGIGAATDFRDHLDRLIRANLTGFLTVLEQLHRETAEKYPQIVTFAEETYRDFSSVWRSSQDREAEDDSTELPFLRAPAAAPGSEDEEIKKLQSRMKELFAPLYRVLLKTIELAPGYFETDLANRHDIQPHLALFIAFLRLYVQVRDDANRLGRKHLEFFYQSVLGIQRRPAVADQVHVIVELARQIQDEHRLARGLDLDAGKDGTGVPLRYRTVDDLVANRAQINSFRTVFVDSSTGRVHAARVANSRDGMGAEIEDKEQPSWPTLGNSELPLATIGFAIASRVLLLAEGTRKIAVEFSGTGLPGLNKLPADSLVVQLSGAKGWIKPDAVNTDVQPDLLRLQITLEPGTDAVTWADAKVLKESFGTTDPILKVTLNQSKLEYGLLKAIQLNKVTVEVSVNGLTTVVAQNDQSVMDPSKPFQPFGSSPVEGSNFYIGSAEAFQKRLTKIGLDITWLGLPPEFKKHYEAYDIPTKLPENNDFKVRPSFLQAGIWKTTDEFSLFKEQEIVLTLPRNPSQEVPLIDELGEWTPASRNGFLRLTLLEKTFFHAVYPQVLTRQILAVARFPQCIPLAIYMTASGPKTCPGNVPLTTEVPLVPNEPYTPTIKTFKLNYDAGVSSDESEGGLTFFHIEPFGYRTVLLPGNIADVTLRENNGPSPLLPQFDHEAALFLGIRDLKPRQSLSILFQVAEATANSEVAKPKVLWSYLADDRWVDFEQSAVIDDTRGLVASGIVTFRIPREITAQHTLLPSGSAWLRAAVIKNARGVSQLINAHTNALKATFVDRKNDPRHLESPLPTNSVKGLERDDAAVAAITQPYDSFGARPNETDLAYYTRVAEHLRHKGRPITVFDYERLVLENFPKIYKAKCVNHTNAGQGIAPGHVMLALVPDFSRLKAANRRAPKVTVDELETIANFIEAINCPFVSNHRTAKSKRLHVVNPTYEYVRVDFKVRFAADVTAVGFQRLELMRAINRFLSPWAFENGADIMFGGRIHKSTILKFIEQQDYVDYVTDMRMRHEGIEEDLEAIEAATPRSILIPSETHGIELIDD